MRNALIFCLVFLAGCAYAQNHVKATGLSYSDGLPAWAPSEKSGSELAIDTITGWVYQWHRTAGPSNAGTWVRLGQGIDDVTGGVAPSYVPFRNQSWFVINNANPRELYAYNGATWECLSCAAAGTVTSDATLDGNGTGGSPLSIAQQSAATGQVLSWTGATWEPTWGNPTTFVTAGGNIATSVNTVLIGTIGSDITLGLPTCNAANDTKIFRFIKNGSDLFGVTIDPNGAELFSDGDSFKKIYSPLSLTCDCRYSGGSGAWYFNQH